MPGVRRSLDPGNLASAFDRIEAPAGRTPAIRRRSLHRWGPASQARCSALVKAAAVEVIGDDQLRGAERPQLPAAIPCAHRRLRVPLLRLALRSETPSRWSVIRPWWTRSPMSVASLAPDCSRSCRSAGAGVDRAPGRPCVRCGAKSSRRPSGGGTVCWSPAAGEPETRAVQGRSKGMERRDAALHHACRALYLLMGRRQPQPGAQLPRKLLGPCDAKAAYRHGLGQRRVGDLPAHRHRLLASADDGQAAEPTAAGANAEIPRPDEDGEVCLGRPTEISILGRPGALYGVARQPDRRQAGPRKFGAAPLLLPAHPGPPRRKSGLRVLQQHYVPANLPLPPAWAALEVGDTVSVGLPDGSVIRGFVAHVRAAAAGHP